MEFEISVESPLTSNDVSEMQQIFVGIRGDPNTHYGFCADTLFNYAMFWAEKVRQNWKCVNMFSEQGSRGTR